MHDFDPFGFNKFREENERWRSEAKDTFVNGVDIADLKAGQQITVSPNLRINDRSYSRDVLIVRAINSGHVQVEDEYGNLRVLCVHEHHFYDATGFVREQKGQSNDT